MDARVEAFAPFLSVVFPVLRLHAFLVGLAPGRRKAGPRVVSPAPLAREREVWTEPPEILRQRSVRFPICFRGKCCPVFSEDFFSEIFPPTVVFFQCSIIRLRFFLGRLFAMNFEFGVRSFSEILFFAPQKRREKSSPFLSFFLEFYFVTRWFLEGFGARTPLLVLELLLFVSGCAFL